MCVFVYRKLKIFEQQTTNRLLIESTVNIKKSIKGKLLNKTIREIKFLKVNFIKLWQMDSLLPDICTVLIQDEVKESLVVTYATTSPGTGNCMDN